jgi:hypothetical protein
MQTSPSKSIFAGDLNAKHPFWNNEISNTSCEKHLQLFDVNYSYFEISASQSPTHYSPAGNGDVLDIVVHQNIRLTHVTVSDILDSDYLPIVFHIVDHVTTKKTLGTTRKMDILGTVSQPYL